MQPRFGSRLRRHGYAFVLGCVSTLAATSSCVQSTSVTCTDRSVCPSGTECAAVTTLAGSERVMCVRPQQREACIGKVDGDSCELADAIAGGACHSGSCLPVECANGLLDPGEVCDDENLSNADDCSSDCRSDLTCGNAVLDTILEEQCDFGDAIGHDGCASTCQVERAAGSR